MFASALPPCRVCRRLPRWRMSCVAGTLLASECQACRLSRNFRRDEVRQAVWAAIAAHLLDTHGEPMRMTMLERREKRNPAEASVDEGTLRRFPILAEYLSQSRWPDGSERELATVLLCFEGTWKAGLLDKAEGQSLWASADALAGVLEALEKRLAKAGPADWREMRQPGAKRR